VWSARSAIATVRCISSLAAAKSIIIVRAQLCTVRGGCWQRKVRPTQSTVRLNSTLQLIFFRQHCIDCLDLSKAKALRCCSLLPAAAVAVACAERLGVICMHGRPGVLLLPAEASCLDAAPVAPAFRPSAAAMGLPPPLPRGGVLRLIIRVVSGTSLVRR
jgi:hypothetical protein